jgi:hypothetical protein
MRKLAETFTVGDTDSYHRYVVFYDRLCGLVQWYSTFFVCIPPNIISLLFCTPKVVGG